MLCTVELVGYIVFGKRYSPPNNNDNDSSKENGNSESDNDWNNDIDDDDHINVYNNDNKIINDNNKKDNYNLIQVPCCLLMAQNPGIGFTGVGTLQDV